MEMSYAPRKYQKKPRKKRRVFFVAFLSFLFMISCGWLGLLYWLEQQPSDEHMKPQFHGVDKPLFYQGNPFDQTALGSGESLQLPLEFVKDRIDPALRYEEESGSVIIATQDRVVRLKTDQLTATINDKPFDLRFPARKVDGVVYVPIQPIRELYRIELREDESSGAVLLFKDGDTIVWGKARVDPEHPERTVPMRNEASIKAPILFDLPQAQQAMILAETDGWYHIQLSAGYTGYALKSDIQFDRVESVRLQPESPAFVPWSPVGGKINMTWEAVYNNNNPDTSQIGDMPGLNVVSPTWFHLLKDKQGQFYIQNMADPAYVKWAHDRGYQVWGLFSNSFEPDLTSEALASYDSRMQLIKQLISFAGMYGLQGINIDFENVYVKDKDLVTQFVREMTPLMHEQGLVVSMDVTIRGGSEMWSLFYDRAALSRIVDYMIVMTYDEHWASSPVAGSVASLPWVEKGMTDIMNEDHVPASKLILGVPYYTRVWTEETKDGKTTVSSRTVFMSFVQRTIREKQLKPVYDEKSGQYYVEYKEGDATAKIWIENEESMRKRVELVKKYDFAGVASWRRGFETAEIWDTVKQTLEKRP